MECPSPILDFVNLHFYGNRLVSDDSVKNRMPGVVHPFQFISTSEEGSGTEERHSTGHSYINVYECGVIKAILRGDPDIQTILNNAEKPRIIVITPYKAQADKLRKVLKGVSGINSSDVNTVDSFQGT